jgi:hypothetical protein
MQAGVEFLLVWVAGGFPRIFAAPEIHRRSRL